MHYDPVVNLAGLVALLALLASGVGGVWRFGVRITHLIDSQSALADSLKELAQRLGEHIQRSAEAEELREARLAALEAAISNWQRYSRQWKGN